MFGIRTRPDRRGGTIIDRAGVKEKTRWSTSKPKIHRPVLYEAMCHGGKGEGVRELKAQWESNQAVSDGVQRGRGLPHIHLQHIRQQIGQAGEDEESLVHRQHGEPRKRGDCTTARRTVRTKVARACVGPPSYVDDDWCPWSGLHLDHPCRYEQMAWAVDRRVEIVRCRS